MINPGAMPALSSSRRVAHHRRRSQPPFKHFAGAVAPGPEAYPSFSEFSTARDFLVACHLPWPGRSSRHLILRYPEARKATAGMRHNAARTKETTE
jgi:hypothetical protein